MESFCHVVFTFVVALLTAPTSGQYASEPLNIRPRVIAGIEIQNRCQSPWNHMVALQFESSNGPVTFCSAVMLTDQILVTSAICISQFAAVSTFPITAIVGERDMIMRDTYEQRFQVDSVKIHNRYNASTFDNNIGLIKLSGRATLNSCVKPAARWEMDPSSCNDIDRSCVMAGWGPYAETDKPTNSRLPRSASLTVYGDLVTSLLSRDQYGTDQPIGSLYAEGTNPANKACFFDFGGIVSCERNGNNVLRGIIGDHNCNVNGNTPILVSDVPFHQNWIDRCIDNWDNCPSQ